MVISGLPASGKTTLACQLASELHLPVIDKDSILEDLFASRGVGDAAWRRMLSRESDLLLAARARASEAAILVSFWHHPTMAADVGTPTAWLSELAGRVVNVHCVCPTEIAAQRFLRRQRHPGHLDTQRDYQDVLQSLLPLAELRPIEIESRIEIDTSQPVDLAGLVSEVDRAFAL